MLEYPGGGDVGMPLFRGGGGMVRMRIAFSTLYIV